MSELVYVDTSALISSRVAEPHSDWAVRALTGRMLTSSVVAEIELARYARRRGEPFEIARELADQISFVTLNGAIVDLAKIATENVKSLDAIHLGTWMFLAASGIRCDFVTADRKLASAAHSAGAHVIHPFGQEL